jgi:RimJ/RimL family protein N-acetyltransferase
MEVEPVILTGNHIRLEPLSEAHIDGLAETGSDPSIWTHLLYGAVTTPEKMAAYVHARLAEKASGSEQPFSVIHLASGKVAGSTRYMDIRPTQRGLEIGGTWYGTAFQRTAVNTEAKYLLLRHAFESLGCIRVQLKTDVRNERSQRAIERIGGVREGVLRNHMIRPDGTYRDSVFYSILDREWPDVKIRLEALLQPR